MSHKIKLSATAIDNFESCNIRWRNSQLYRLRKIEESDSLRWGTVWHKLQELVGDMDIITNYIKTYIYIQLRRSEY